MSKPDDFLNKSDIDDFIEKMIAQISSRHEDKKSAQLEIDKFYEETLIKISDSILVDVTSYSDDQSKLFDSKLEETKNELNQLLSNTIPFMKNLFLKSLEIHDYLFNNTGLNDNKGSINYEGKEIIKFSLIRIYNKFLETLSEIIVLIERGLVFGAEARWRQLNELSVISTVLSVENNDKLALSYIDHDQIAILKAAKLIDIYESSHSDFVKELEEKRENLVNKYGKNYVKAYGWYLPDQVINFVSLAIKYNHSKLLGYVNVANLSNHASSYNLGNLDNKELKYRVNYMETLVQNSVINLSQITTNLIGYYLESNNLVTASGFSIIMFYNKSFKKIAEYYFDERNKIDKTKPLYKDLPPQ